ncbi:MAG TPA: hypothetical protein VFS36_16350 [Chitinophagaceae bacterium]|jgi:hypothetical protein|nr:hypothetical protein [Chitinophagaceae bacterium]
MMQEQIEAIELSGKVASFMEMIKEDARINPAHISLYSALVHCCRKKQYLHPVTVFSHEIMPLCKISGTATYHRSIRELHQYGYIRYVPSYNHFLGSLVYFKF